MQPQPHGRDRRFRFVLYHVVPMLLFSATTAGVLVWHIMFGAGPIGLLVFLASGFLAVAFAVLAVVEWLRFQGGQ